MRVEVEEDLHLLEPVARHRGDDPAAHDLEQVDEDAAAQQVVDLRLAGAVAAHQPAQRGDLVGGVVVDVHVGVLAQARVDEVDERLERGLLARVVVGPERREVVVRVEHAPEVLEAPVLVPERVALDVEEEVAGRGVGQEREAGVGVRREELVDGLAGLAALELEPRPGAGAWRSAPR